MAISLIVIVVIVLAGAGYYFYTTSAPSTMTSSTSAMVSSSMMASSSAAPSPIYIGVITPLSAPADYISGKQILATAQLYVNYTNANGGLVVNGTHVPLALTVQDQTLDPATAISALQLEETQYHIVGLVGPWESLVALPVANATQQFPTIMFCTYSWADAITGNHYKYVFRTGVYNSLIATKLAEYLKYKGLSNIVQVAEDSSFGRGFNTALMQAMNVSMPNAKLTTIFTPPGATDYTSALTTFMTMSPKPDTLIMTLNVPGAVTAAKEAYDMGFQKFATVIQSVDWPTYDGGTSWWQAVGQNGVGGIYASWSPPSLNLTAPGQTFTSLFEKSQGHPPAFWLIWYWDSLRMLGQAIQATGSTNPDVLANYIQGASIQGSTGGTITYDNSGGPGSPLWHQWTGENMYIYEFTEVNQPTNSTKLIYITP
jgi:branched-chain amino acid transport system substrate-binding protein